MVIDRLLALPSKFSGLEIEEWVLMPNHLHLLLWLGQVSEPVDQACHTLGEAIQWFKTMTTNAYIRGVRDSGWPRFNLRLWQRGSYDEIIRDERHLESVCDYIRANPANWLQDEYMAD